MIKECFGQFRSTKCDLQCCDTIHNCEKYSMCLADCVRLMSENSDLRKELADLRQGLCQLNNCNVPGSRKWAAQYGDLNPMG